MFPAHLPLTISAGVVNAVPDLAARPPGLLIGVPGVPLFGIFGTLVLVMVLASAFGGPSRSHGDPSGRGMIVAFTVLFVVMLVIRVSMR